MTCTVLLSFQQYLTDSFEYIISCPDSWLLPEIVSPGHRIEYFCSQIKDTRGYIKIHTRTYIYLIEK